MKYLDVCTGISAATVAWRPLGWQAAAFAEIDKFPSAVLAHHYPETRNLGDFTRIKASDVGPIDLLVGGTPCQDFSIAGLRAGVAGERGNLTLEFLRLAQRLRPRWLVWENVPGVYSSTSNDAPDHSHDGDGRWQDDANESHAFACFLAGLQELGYGFAYRTLDARYFGVPQRRRRVFVVGHLGDWRRAAAVLFERSCLSGDTPPRREARKDLAPTLSARTHGGGGLGTDFDLDGGLIQQAFGGNNTSGPIDVSTAVNACATASGRIDFETETFIAHSLSSEGFDASEDGTGRGVPLISETLSTRYGDASDRDLSDSSAILPVAFNLRGRAGGAMPECSDVASVRAASGGSSRSYVAQTAVRRLTPRECERLQGFPDDYTKISAKAADGPRYKALGNSMAVPVMRWIGERISVVESITKEEEK
jgi:DNA (cytosine-5)-methyltransferase 1